MSGIGGFFLLRDVEDEGHPHIQRVASNEFGESITGVTAAK